jgi:ACS family hexuronate transporter-like MFS transporter
MRHVATVFGLIAAGSATGGLLSTQLVGQLASTHAYGGLFLLMGMLHPIALLIAWVSLRGRKNEQHR